MSGNLSPASSPSGAAIGLEEARREVGRSRSGETPRPGSVVHRADKCADGRGRGSAVCPVEEARWLCRIREDRTERPGREVVLQRLAGAEARRKRRGGRGAVAARWEGWMGDTAVGPRQGARDRSESPPSVAERRAAGIQGSQPVGAVDVPRREPGQRAAFDRRIAATANHSEPQREHGRGDVPEDRARVWVGGGSRRTTGSESCGQTAWAGGVEAATIRRR